MNTSTVTGLESSHIWLCDGQGDVYLLQDFHMYKVADLITKEDVPPPTVAPPPLLWKKIDSGFSAVVGGCSGLVCGIQKRNLCIRFGVTHDNPPGNAWGKVHCEAAEVAVGSSFIVRRTTNGKVFFVDMTTYDLMKAKSVLILKWRLVPPCPKGLWKEESELQYMSMDENDNFFLINCTGNVCLFMLGSANATWCKVSGAPVVHRKGGMFNWLSKVFWREDEEQKCTFLGASAGQRSIWCLDSEPRVVWQLVISYVPSRIGGKLVKTNWVRCELPTEDELVCFCADRCTVDGLLFAAKNKDNSDTFFHYCSLSKAGNTPMKIRGPSSSSSCKSISICRTSVNSTPSYEPGPSQSTVPSVAVTTFQTKAQMLYPDLSQEDTDNRLCCETGDCYFCRKRASQPSLLQVLEDTEYPRRKRRRVESDDDEDFVPKKARFLPYSYHDTLDGVDVIPSPEYFVLEVMFERDIWVFNYSFSRISTSCRFMV